MSLKKYAQDLENYPLHKQNFSGAFKDLGEAYGVAIKGLLAWDKVIEEIKKAEMPTGRMCYFDDGKAVALEIIQKYLGEVEE